MKINRNEYMKLFKITGIKQTIRSITFAVGHTKVNTPDPIRTPKLSALRLG